MYDKLCSFDKGLLIVFNQIFNLSLFHEHQQSKSYKLELITQVVHKCLQ